MADLNKLDNLIENLENSTESIMQISEVIKEVKKTSESVNNNVKEIEKLELQLSELYKISSTNNILCENSAKALEDYCSYSRKQNANFENNVNTLILETKNENNALYKAFENAISMKFEHFKTGVLFENRKIIEAVNKNLDDKFIELYKKLDKKLKLLIILIGCSVAISLFALVLSFLKILR